VLYHKYISNAINQNGIFLPSFNPENRGLPFEGKLNFIFQGLIFIGGSFGLILCSKNIRFFKYFTLISSIFTFYAFVVIFDSRFSLLVSLLLFIVILIFSLRSNLIKIPSVFNSIFTVFRLKTA
jgi:hypothetical protein